MGHRVFFTKIGHWLINILHLQLFLTLISWPILIFWGLPLSMMSPLGNLIFSPIVTLFLLLSSFIFFCELLCIPNAYLIYLLEKLTWVWLKVIHISSPHWLFGMPLVMSLLLISLPFIAIAIIYYRPWGISSKNLLGLIFLFSFSLVAISFAKKRSFLLTKIDGSRQQTVSLYSVDQKALVISSTGLQKKGLDDWIEYNLQPELIKMSGSTFIDHLIVIKPNKSAFELAAALIEKGLTDHLYIKTWDNWLDGPVYWTYKNMQALAKQKGIAITYFQEKIHINLGRGLLKIPDFKL